MTVLKTKEYDWNMAKEVDPFANITIKGGFSLDKKFEIDFNQSEEYIKQKLDLDGCKLCRSGIVNISNSTQKDLVVMCAFRRMDDAYPNIRSIRSAGCKATIVIFTDKLPKHEKLFQKCGVLISVIPGTENLPKTEMMYFRFIAMKIFLEHHKDDFDRVLYVDIFDSYYQADPFTGTVSNNTIYVSSEKTYHRESGWSLDWARNLKGIDFYRFFGDKLIFCGGTFLADTYTMLKVATLVSSMVKKNYETFLVDQIAYDWVLASDIPERLGINVLVNPHFASIHFKIDDYHDNAIGNISYEGDGFKPAILHQVTRRDSLVKIFFDACKAEWNDRMK
ncbi:hypothetical protein TVAG_431790 [Trichomonas vaginalis G3]|uniref:Uncharacterized protein n=1 Tax=Trichomonas vaginalis (strain ATCC PRA-98 / G3) TaxID=412133 RepID=A2F7X6_TRIV3|nr:nucleotide-diphospho-sugar transferases family [Trichomonas vaginalis G3]EAX98970.1 hypothetical protein TVAG_431790 [Trichomonas vaginalis G3]KAI5507228.1 nucleotide-diphospho-sugar transferases family [Trichomonas vaginalis G3]|eukprot:XP_001311900.1 hypothetical protein [Trichomonas vaginalis G3]